MLMVGDGSCLRHPIYIQDMVTGLRLAAEASGAAGRTYILGGEAPVPVGELIGAVARVVGRHLRIIRLSPRAARPLFRAVEAIALAAGRTPPVSPRSLKFFLQQTAYDISRSRRELGFVPRYPLPAGLQETYHWLKAARGWE
jgi:nucleoside-diphosphate-sugar epimerase